MTVETNDTIERLTISGTGPYAFSFRIFASSDLTVHVDTGDIDPVLLAINTHYTVSGVNDEDGGTITLTSAAASTYAGDTLDIRSNTTEYQPTSIRNQGAFLPEIHEDALDRLSRQIQDLRRVAARCLRLPDNVLTDAELSPLSSWTDRYITVNSSGEPEPALLIDSTLTQSSFNQFLDGSEPYKRTAAEIAAGVTPSDYSFAELETAKRYGAVGDAITADHQAIQREINVAQQYPEGADVDLGRGRYRIESGLTITGSRIHLRGRGKYATQLIFAPSSNGTAIDVSNGASRIDQGSIRDLTITTSDTTYEKVGISLQSIGGYELHNVLITGTGVNKWTGGAGGSICLRIKGRDTSSLQNLELFGQRCIYVMPDPNQPTISLDHFNVHNLYMIGSSTSYPLVGIASATYLTQISFTGFQAWVGGGDGLLWVDTGSSAVSGGVVLENIRWESGDATKYMVRIEHNTALQALQLRNCRGGDRNGLYLRKVENVSLDGFYYATTLEALNIDSTVRRVVGSNCFFQATSTKTVSGQRLDLGSPTDPNTGTLPPNFIYNQSANADDTFNIGRTTTFTVTRNSFTEVLGGGTITATGSYTKIGKRVDFDIKVVCAGGATIESVGNTSYFGGLPAGSKDGGCQVTRIDNTTSLGNGWVQASGANVLTPTWAAVANASYIINGSYEVA